MANLRPFAYVLFLYEAQGTNDGERHLPHLEFGGHCGEMSLEGEVHECRMEDVVVVMSQGYLVAVERLCEIEHLLATMP